MCRFWSNDCPPSSNFVKRAYDAEILQSARGKDFINKICHKRTSLELSGVVIEEWRCHYNTIRPHSALGWNPPAPETIVPMDRMPIMH